MKIADRIVMVVAGLVFIVAAALKTHQLLTEPVVSEGFWESWAFFLIQIPLEFGLGIWLVSGLFRKAAWLISVMAFAAFIAVTLQKGLMGLESCGCFGKVVVNPWVTLLAVDTPFFLLLLFFRPKGEKLLPLPWPSAKHFWGVAVPAFVFLAIIVPVLILNKPPDKTDKYEVVRPQEWTKQVAVGKQTALQQPKELWPMLRHIDIADSLRSDIVVVLLYRSECEDCHEAIPFYDQMARDMAGENSIRFAFVEVPPYASEKDKIIPDNTPCLTGKLDSSKQWLNIKTPLVVAVMNGSVVKFWQEQSPSLDEILNAVSADDSR